jgi:hypothetical protein
VAIGAVLIPGGTAPKLVTRAMLKKVKRVIVDVSIDQDGFFETSKPTTHRAPTYEVDGVIQYCVANMPGAVPLTSSRALVNATLPYGLALANRGLKAIRESTGFQAGLNVCRAQITATGRDVARHALHAAARSHSACGEVVTKSTLHHSHWSPPSAKRNSKPPTRRHRSSVGLPRGHLDRGPPQARPVDRIDGTRHLGQRP